MSTHKLKVSFATIDKSALFNEAIRYRRERGGRKNWVPDDIKDAFMTIFFECSHNPEMPKDVGVEILKVDYRLTSIKVSQGIWHSDLTVTFDVLDEEKLRKAARTRYEKAWNDPSWRPKSPQEAFYENFIASNDNPESPLDLGVEIENWKAA